MSPVSWVTRLTPQRWNASYEQLSVGWLELFPCLGEGFAQDLLHLVEV
jgi:hypothetical protein